MLNIWKKKKNKILGKTRLVFCFQKIVFYKKKYFLFFFSIYISSIDTISFILNSSLLNVILSTASYRPSNRKLFSNIVRVHGTI